MDDLAVTAIHQNIRHLLFELVTTGDRDEVSLALVLRDIDQVSRGEARRLRQDGTRDRDFVVSRETLDDVRGRLFDRRETLGEFGTGVGLDPCDEAGEHLIEDADLLGVELRGSDQKQVGDAPERLDALFGRSALDRPFQFLHQRRAPAHRTTVRLLRRFSSESRSSGQQRMRVPNASVFLPVIYFEAVNDGDAACSCRSLACAALAACRGAAIRPRP